MNLTFIYNPCISGVIFCNFTCIVHTLERWLSHFLSVSCGSLMKHFYRTMIKVPLHCGEKLQISPTQEKDVVGECCNMFETVVSMSSEQYLQLYLTLIYCLLSCAARKTRRNKWTHQFPPCCCFVWCFICWHLMHILYWGAV